MGRMGTWAVRGFAALACLALAAAGHAETPPKKPDSVAGQAAEKYDTKLPVEISADNLEVLQHDNKAIFKGNVIAVQGKIRLKADTMIIHYKQKDQRPAQPAQTPAAPVVAKTTATSASSDTAGMGAITLIETEGNVFVATPEESAKGDKGNYQVPEKMLHLTGDNVILTRDKNILRGTELEYNLETGHSVLTNKGGKVDGTNGGRVRGVFVPTNDQSKDKGKDKSAGKTKNSVKPDAQPSAPAPATPAPAAPSAPVAAPNP
jgi:lipopolysaccharide export system protein LptA